jgi:hypothetical protein
LILTERRKLAHEIRNGMNTMSLNLLCVPISTGDEAVECVDAILAAADLIADSVDRIAALPDGDVDETTGGAPPRASL